MSRDGCFSAFCTLRLVTARTSVSIRKQNKRFDFSNFSLPFLWQLILHPIGLHFFDLLVLPLLDKGGEGWRKNLAYVRTCHGSVLKIRMACKVLIIKIISMARDSSPRGENVSILNGNGEKAMPPL